MLYKSNIFSQASGSLDGTVFSHNSSGRYVRNRTIPTNPQSTRQNAIRGLFGAISGVWGSVLSQAERHSWDVYARNITFTNRVGDAIFLSAFNHFCRSAVPRAQAGLPTGPSGPTELTLPTRDPALSAFFRFNTDLINVQFDDTLDWVSEDGAGLLVAMGLPQPPSRNFFATPYRFAGVIQGDSGTPPTSPQTLAAPFVLGAGQRVWMRARITRADGRLSTFSTFNDETIF